MTALEKLDLVPVEEYLAGELESQTKHEYLGGVVYAMAGATNAHNTVALNVLTFLRSVLRGKKCRPFNSDTKVRIRLATQTRFYYPDGMVVCDPNPADDSFQDQPAVLFEVASKSTRRVDEGEKKDAYLTIPTLGTYLIIEPDRPAAVVWRRTPEGFVREVHTGIDAVISLPEIETELPLSEIYEDVELAAGPEV